MAKKDMKENMDVNKSICPMCKGSPCTCMSSGWCKALLGVVVAVLGLLLIWPKGWFSFQHTFGVLVFLVGLKMIWWGFKKCH